MSCGVPMEDAVAAVTPSLTVTLTTLTLTLTVTTLSLTVTNLALTLPLTLTAPLRWAPT